MSSPNPFVLIAILLMSAALMAGLVMWPGALMVSLHEGDTYHMLDILYRLEAGETQHVDFMTPLGRLAFLPIEFLMARGMSAGQAMLWSQVLVAGGLAPALIYAAWSRLARGLAYAFVGYVMVLVLALSFGGAGVGLSMSMYYNRWAWAVALILIVIAFLPGRRLSTPVLDGMILGLGFSALVFLKATFFVALLPGVALVLAGERRWAEVVSALVVGAVVAAAVTLVLGFGFWGAYMGDLATVAHSKVRPNPTGISFAEMLSQVQNIVMLLVAGAAYAVISRSGDRVKALGLIVLVLGGLYVTYQNFGNDPKWLMAVAIVVAGLAAAHVEPAQRTRFAVVALLAAALHAPSALTMALSAPRHAAQVKASYDPMLPAKPESDVWIRRDRANTMTAEVQLDVPDAPWASYAEVVGRPEPDRLGGVTFPACQLLAGTAAYFTEIGDDMLTSGVPSGSQLFVTDILIAFWLFHDFAPLESGAPWYYGGLSGIENADYVLVPKCTFVARIRGIMLAELNASGRGLDLVRDTETYALFRLR